MLVSTIRRAFERSDGRGLFVMGPVDDETINKPEWQGLASSRRQCRVTQRPVAILYFTYRKEDPTSYRELGDASSGPP